MRTKPCLQGIDRLDASRKPQSHKQAPHLARHFSQSAFVLIHKHNACSEKTCTHCAGANFHFRLLCIFVHVLGIPVDARIFF